MVLDMGMSHVTAAGGAMGVYRDDLVSAPGGNTFPMQNDLKGAEVDIFQNDTRCVDAQDLRLEVNGHRLELF